MISRRAAGMLESIRKNAAAAPAPVRKNIIDPLTASLMSKNADGSPSSSGFLTMLGMLEDAFRKQQEENAKIQQLMANEIAMLKRKVAGLETAHPQIMKILGDAIINVQNRVKGLELSAPAGNAQ